MKVDVILGLQWGDEGKGKIVDFLAPKYDIVCRFQGGPNAGHTLVFEGNKYVLHTIPSGIFRSECLSVIGGGVVIDPITLAKEISLVQQTGIDVHKNLKISKSAHLILPTHRLLDKASELAKGKHKIGSTLRGIGPTYMDLTGRNGLRIGDIFSNDFEQRYARLKDKHLKLLEIYPPFDMDLAQEEALWFSEVEAIRKLDCIQDAYFLNTALDNDKHILAEGAQGTMLDINFGTYPFVTSSNTVTAGVCSGLGIPPNRIDKVYGITKAYCTRVGSGPFPTELFDADGEKLQEYGHEFGATTGRPRRCGWIDLPQLKYANMINGVTDLIMTKIDVLDNFSEVKACTKYKINGQETDQWPYDSDLPEIEVSYERYTGWNTPLTGIEEYDQLPAEAKNYIDTIEGELGKNFAMISFGPSREQLWQKKG